MPNLLAGTGILALIFNLDNVTDLTGGFGANGLASINDSIWAGLIVEVLLTFVFVISIFDVTSKKAGHGHVFGLVIALSLVAVHILGIGFGVGGVYL